MPSQPLSNVRPKGAGIEVGAHVFRDRPALALPVIQVIAIWSYSDTQLVQLIAKALKADQTAVASMLTAITSADARRAAILGGLKNLLEPADFTLVRAVLKVIKPSQQIRHSFAHNIWGASPQIPDALLLIDSRSLIFHGVEQIAWGADYETRRAAGMAKLARGEPIDWAADQPPDIDHSKVEVWREPDLLAEVAAAGLAAQSLSLLFQTLMVEYTTLSEAARSDLLAQPAIVAAIEKIERES